MPAANSRFGAIGADGLNISSSTKPGGISGRQIKLGSISNFNFLLLIWFYFRADSWKISKCAKPQTLIRKCKKHLIIKIQIVT